MRNKIISILTISFFLLSAVIATVLFMRIKEKNKEKTHIAEVEAKVIDKLILIRKAETAYFSIKNEYTDNWDSLKVFLNTAHFYITNRTEKIITRPYGGDSVVVSYDTLRSIAVKDSLYKKEHPNFNINTIEKLPHAEATFNIFAAKFEEEGAVIEVEDSKPVNPARKKGGLYKPLKFGSQSAPTTKGNWEK